METNRFLSVVLFCLYWKLTSSERSTGRGGVSLGEGQNPGKVTITDNYPDKQDGFETIISDCGSELLRERTHRI